LRGCSRASARDEYRGGVVAAIADEQFHVGKAEYGLLVGMFEHLDAELVADPNLGAGPHVPGPNHPR
jgi:hypothetical protein